MSSSSVNLNKKRSNNGPRKTPWIVILGAGLGGLSVAATLDAYMEENDAEMNVVLVDRNHSLILQTANQFALVGRSRPEQVSSAYADLSFKRCFFVQDEIVSINSQQRVVYGRGHRFRYDKLIIALGVESNGERVYQMNRSAYDISKMTHVMQLKDTLADFRGGNILVTIGSVPSPGPVAAYSYAMLIRTTINQKMQKKISDKTQVIVTSPAPTVFKPILNEMENQGIIFRPLMIPHFVDSKKRSIIFKNGEKIEFDVLVSQMPTQAPKLLSECGFALEGEFVPTNVRTMRTNIPNVYCIGDCAEFIGFPEFPKAGAMSTAQGAVVANDIIRDYEQNDDAMWLPENGVVFEENVTIYCEVGSNMAVPVTYLPDGGVLEVGEPSKASMKQLIKWWDSTVSSFFEDQSM